MRKLLPLVFLLGLFVSLEVNAQLVDTNTCIVGVDTLSFTVHYQNESCPDSCNGLYFFEHLIGSGNYSYSVTSGVYSSTTIEDSFICDGMYLYTVNDLTTGVSCSDTFWIDTLTPINWTLNLTDYGGYNVSAPLACDGGAWVDYTGGTPPVTVYWYNSSMSLIGTGDSIGGLCAGNYFYKVVDSSLPCCAVCLGGGPGGNSAAIGFAISPPPSWIAASVTNYFPPCGMLDNGGWYDYDQGTQVVSNIMGNAPSWEVWAAMTGYSETSNGGSVIGATSCEWFFNWSYDPQEGASITDAAGYGEYFPATIEASGPGWPICSIPDANLTAINGCGPCGGSIIVTSLGDMNYMNSDYYPWIITLTNNGGTLIATDTISSGNPQVTFSNLCDDTYDVHMVNNYGCESYPYGTLNNVTIENLAEPALSDTVSYNLCNSCGSSIELSANSGLPNYQFSIDNGASYQGSGTFTNLCNGTYDAMVADANGCIDTMSILISAPVGLCNPTQYIDTTTCSSLTYTIDYDQQTCPAACNGNYNITILNGVGPYTYLVTGPSYSSSLAVDSNLCVGTYNVSVTDVGQGITCNTSFNILPLTTSSYSVSTTNTSGAGNCDGTATVTITGGVPPYIIQWYDQAQVAIPWETGFTIDSLCAGTYYFKYWDNTPACGSGYGPGSGGSGLIPVDIYDPVVVTILNIYEANCPGGCDGGVDYQVTGGTGVYNIPAVGSEPACDGQWGQIIAIDTQGAGDTATYNLTPWPWPNAFPAASSTSCAGACDGSIFIDDWWMPGTDYYSIDGGNTFQASPDFQNLCSGSYDVGMLVPTAYGGSPPTDGCYIPLGTIDVYEDNYTPPLTITTINETCGPNCNGSITINDINSEVNQFDVGFGYQTSNTFNNLCPGDYDIWVQNAAGCSYFYGTETIYPGSGSVTYGTDVQTACDMFTWIDGNTYTSNNNTATWTLMNASGCDSIITLDLTIFNSSVSTDTQTACDSYTWIDGNTYTASNNTATWTLTNASGCDSVVTLDLTINNSTTGTDIQTACDAFTWIDGNTYTSSNNTATWLLTNSQGCDSLVTLDLTVNYANTGTEYVTACDSFTWIDNNTYTVSTNSPTYTLTNVSGCDSLAKLDLTIINSSSGSENQIGCGSYTWHGYNYTSTGTYYDTIPNAAGCDSIVELYLVVYSLPDTSITQMGIELTSNQDSGGQQSSVFYQWLDCNNNFAEISGATDQTYIPSQNGSYAVALMFGTSGCADTSACIIIGGVGIVDNQLGESLKLYPNPTNGELTIDLGKQYEGVTVKQINLLGQLVKEETFKSIESIQTYVEGAPGVYQFEIYVDDERKVTLSVLKE